MKQEALAYFTDIQYTIAALIIFVTYFTGVLIWVYRKSSQGFYNKMADMPLMEDGNNER